MEDELGTRHLVVRDLGELHSRILADTEIASTPFFSPDGQSIAYFANGRLWRRPVSGGSAWVVTETSYDLDNRGATWAADGSIYAAPVSTPRGRRAGPRSASGETSQRPPSPRKG